MLSVFRVVVKTEVAVDQVLVAIQTDVILSVGREDEEVEAVEGVHQFSTHFGYDVIKNAASVVCAFA